jgi:alcohol dehydrogenase class IV
MHFEFATATRILFGPGKIREVPSAAASWGRRALIVHSSRTPDRLDAFISELQTHNVECTRFSTMGEPTIPKILEGIGIAKSARCELVIGYGGGSALDGAKAISALMMNPGNPLDYLEVVGAGKPLVNPCAPCICIPTTAGAGSEVTRNAVLTSPEHRVKVSLRSPRMFPILSVIDPELTYSLPASVTASTGMDALTQLIEPFVCKNANPLVDALCREGIHLAAHSLRTAFHDGGDAKARENMSLAALLGGLALTNAGLGAVHGIAAPLGGMFPVPHGTACARLLPFLMETNIRALNARAKDSQTLDRYQEIARLLTGKPDAKKEEGFEWVQAMCSELKIPSLSELGISDKDLPEIAAKALQSSSMRGNPVAITADELIHALRRAL